MKIKQISVTIAILQGKQSLLLSMHMGSFLDYLPSPWLSATTPSHVSTAMLPVRSLPPSACGPLRHLLNHSGAPSPSRRTRADCSEQPLSLPDDDPRPTDRPTFPSMQTVNASSSPVSTRRRRDYANSPNVVRGARVAQVAKHHDHF